MRALRIVVAGLLLAFVQIAGVMPAQAQSASQGIILRVHKSGEPPIIETLPGYSDDFESYTNQALVGGTPNWTAISGGGFSSNEKLNAIANGGVITVKASPTADNTTQGSVTTAGKYELSPYDAATTNQYLIFQAATMASPFAQPNLLAADETHELRIQFTSGTTFRVRKFVGTGTADSNVINIVGSATARYQGGTATNGMTQPAAGDEIRAEVYNGTLHLYRNNAEIGLTAGYDVSTITGTRCGITTYQHAYQTIGYMKCGVLTGHIKASVIQRSWPRRLDLGASYTKGAADIAVSGTYEGALTAMQWRLIDPETGQAITSWARIKTATIAGGNWSATIRIACGISTYANGSARDPKKGYRLDLRSETDTFNETATTVFNIGVPVMIVGQSNGVRALSVYTGSGSIAPDHVGGLMYNPVGWPTTTTGTFGVLTGYDAGTSETGNNDYGAGYLSYQLSQTLNLPIYVMDLAIGAHSAASLDPDAISTEGTWQRSVLATSGGVFEYIVISQGENEENGMATVNPHDWYNQWVTNIAHYIARNGESLAHVPVFVTYTGSYNSSTVNENVNVVRRDQEDFAALTDHYMAASPVGVVLDTESDMTTKVHYSTTVAHGSGEFYRRVGLTMAYVAGSGTYDGNGPEIGTPTRSVATLTIPITLNGATSLTSTTGTLTGITGWEVCTTAACTTSLPILSATLSGTTLTIVLVSPPGAAVYVRFYAGYDPVVTNVIVGTYADGTTIEMRPVANPVVTN